MMKMNKDADDNDTNEMKQRVKSCKKLSTCMFVCFFVLCLRDCYYENY